MNPAVSESPKESVSNPWDFPVEPDEPETPATVAKREADALRERRRWQEEERRAFEKREAFRLAKEAKAEALRQKAANRELVEEQTVALQLRSAQLDVMLKERSLASVVTTPTPETNAEVMAKLKERIFDFDNPPLPPVPILRLGDQTICTPGNVTNIQAPAKAGKSAIIGAIMAAIFNGRRQGSDTLGFSAENVMEHALVHLDTEQSRFDHDALVRRALGRVRLDRPPGWFDSRSVADLSIHERLAALDLLIEKAVTDHGGIFAVIVDGVADLCHDPNDSTEAFALVGHLHTLAIQHECAIITVLHENPGSESGKTRGHLGSQLERKAETNLRLAKASDGITTVFTERARHAHIPRNAGSCFAWSDAAGMHISCGNAKELKEQASQDKAGEEAARAFWGHDRLSFTELKGAIMESLALGDRSAKLRIQKWNSNGIITKNPDGKYTFA
ncbi:AAA family ATPase [Luteolibacter ambystomatis]|uniref:AAA family ATPase n=1 Tax=Luteolibacter ambystomatis TaxID=2824561 RepID=A0A975G8B1_9BACT|nr:AAA family ATPase [Luteolibacter ambystomatis]QUE50570.1 AAA family ATPase [Luteolibacter ambystomatis]